MHTMRNDLRAREGRAGMSDDNAAHAAALLSLREQIAAEVLGPVRAALLAAWDDGNAMGLDGWIGPERGEAPDDYAIDGRSRHVENALAALCAPVQAAESVNVDDKTQPADAERDRWKAVADDIMQHFRSIGSNVSDTYVGLVVSEMWKRRRDLVAPPVQAAEKVGDE